MDTFIWLYNLPVEILIFIFNFSFWVGVVYGIYNTINNWILR